MHKTSEVDTQSLAWLRLLLVHKMQEMHFLSRHARLRITQVRDFMTSFLVDTLLKWLQLTLADCSESRRPSLNILHPFWSLHLKLKKSELPTKELICYKACEALTSMTCNIL